MPTYEYKREDGTVFEMLQSMNDAALTHCPTTGQPVKRLISGGGGVVYKGTGFYVTDYKNGGNKSEGKSKSDTSESKPDTTTPTTSSETTDK